MGTRPVFPLVIFLWFTAAVSAQLPEAAGPWDASQWKQYVTFEVRETAGVARQQEPVEVVIRLPSRNPRVVRWSEPPEEIVSQVLEAQPDGAAYKLRVAFPATVPARSMVRYRIYYDASLPAASYSTALKVSGETRVGWVVENGRYVADASSRAVEGKPEDSGQIRALTLKFADVMLLRSTGPRMHWAPNFQRAGAKSYTGIARWDPVQSVTRRAGPVVAETHRSGYHAEYPGIALSAVYRFFAFVPYFFFRSEMRMTQPLELFLLRNDEMTMDGFFTHVAWPGQLAAASLEGRRGDRQETSGTTPVEAATFEEREKLLEKRPIPADAPWICFFHQEKGYGYGSVRLKFDTRNTAGGPSPLYQPHTKISDGAGGGKYWNRRLIHEHNTLVPAGSRYAEENAYVVFRLRPGGLPEALGEFLEWERKLRTPLVAELYIAPGSTTRKGRRAARSGRLQPANSAEVAP